METNKQQSGGGGGGGLSPLSETLWRRSKKENKNACAQFTSDASAWLTWKDLTVTVTMGSRGETQRVLDGLTGYAEPCTLMALMGPSGSGKSTLLDALAGRLAANAFLSGHILLNGRKTKMSYGTAVIAWLIFGLIYIYILKLIHSSFMFVSMIGVCYPRRQLARNVDGEGDDIVLGANEAAGHDEVGGEERSGGRNHQ